VSAVVERNRIIYERHSTGDDKLERLQDNVQRTIEQIESEEGSLRRRTDTLEDFVIVTGVSMPAAAPVVVTHSLGRVPVRWWPVRVTVGYFEAFETASDDETLTLSSTNACTASIRFE
jgi:hypothetical protein